MPQTFPKYPVVGSPLDFLEVYRLVPWNSSFVDRGRVRLNGVCAGRSEVFICFFVFTFFFSGVLGIKLDISWIS